MPGYARDSEPENGPVSSQDFALDKAKLRRLLEYLGKGPVLVARIEG